MYDKRKYFNALKTQQTPNIPPDSIQAKLSATF